MLTSCCVTAADAVDGGGHHDDWQGDWDRVKFIAVAGPAGTGKTTFVNQLSCLFGDKSIDNSKLRVARRRPSIFSERKVYDHLEALLAPSAYVAERRMLKNLSADEYESEDTDTGLKRLRNDLAGVVAVPSVRDYFEDPELRDWCNSSYKIEYTPNFDDLIRLWDCILDGSVTPSASELVPALSWRTKEIHKHRIEYDNSKYVLVDLPGSSEYRRWWQFPLFSGRMSAVVYLVNLADYNQCLRQYIEYNFDNTQTRSGNSRMCYSALLSTKRELLANVPFFVVGTMYDRLQTKLHRVPFKDFPDDFPSFDGDPLSATDVAEHVLSWFKEKCIYKSIAKLDPIPDGYRLLTVEEARDDNTRFEAMRHPRVEGRTNLPLEESSGTSLWLLDGGMIDVDRKITEGDFVNDDAVNKNLIRTLPLFSQLKRSPRIKQALRESVGKVVYEELLELVCSYIPPGPSIISALDTASVVEVFHHIHSSMPMFFDDTDDKVNEIGDNEVNKIGDGEVNEICVDDEVNTIDGEVSKIGADDEVNEIGDDKVNENGVERPSRSSGKRCIVM